MGLCIAREREPSVSVGLQPDNDNTHFRVLRFWWHVGPILMHYRWEKLLSGGDEADAQSRFERLHKEYAPQARHIVENLGGLYIKAAQALSTRPETTPAAYVAELKKLQSEAPCAQWEPICKTLEQDLNASVEQLFDDIEKEPLGSASIGQAHRVVWRGQHAVVKVQYPGIRDVIRADLKNIEALCELTYPEALTFLKGVFAQFENELDYEKEQGCLRELHQAISLAPEFVGRVAVPAPIEELTKGNVIGMEYFPGPKLEAALRERLEALGISLSSAKDVIFWSQHTASEASRVGEHSQLHSNSETRSGDPVTRFPARRSGCYQRVGHLAIRACGIDGCMRFAGAISDLRLRRSITSVKDLRSVLRLVVSVHGYQIFFCPMFNADPHPGNILLLPDGRVGLIDFGFCARTTSTQKALLARLIHLCACSPPHGECQESDARIVEAMQAIGVKTENVQHNVLSLLPRLAFCKLQAKWLEHNYVKDIMESDKILDLPVFFMMAARCAGLLRGLCLGLQENVSVAEGWQPYAERWLSENGTAAGRVDTSN